jgi:hypothetical protein
MALALFGKKKDAQYQKWVQAYPISEDCTDVDDMLLKLEERWKQEDKEWRETKKIKIQVRINQKRERDTLRDYINDVRNYRKDLVCGVAKSAPAPVLMPAVNTMPPAMNTNLAQTTYVPAQVIDTGNTKAPGGGLIMVPDPQVMQELQGNTTEAPAQAEKKPKATEKKYFGLTKKQLLIGGAVVAAGGAAIYFMRKK